MDIVITIAAPNSVDEVMTGADLYDDPLNPDVVQKFLASPGHHLLYAYADTGEVSGFVSGVELTHPDKGTEMFLYELSVAPAARLQGVGTALVTALVELARALGCYGIWVGTDEDNEAARRTYARAGIRKAEPFVLLCSDL